MRSLDADYDATARDWPTSQSKNVAAALSAITNTKTETVPIELILPSDSPRLDGENEEHIHILAVSQTPLPPIVVHRHTMRVIDGMHRLRASLLRGQKTIEVEFFDGTSADAFIDAVKANINHGLPLTRSDREAAAARIIMSHSHCSDRWIAAVAGLAPATVAGIRRRTCAHDGADALRIGRDGRLRPVSSEEGRRRARDAITRNPEASLREIAGVAGVSPTTVRDVRERMRSGDDPVTPRRHRPPPENAALAQSPVNPGGSEMPAAEPGKPTRPTASLLSNLHNDPSLRFSESGRMLLRRLRERALMPGEWQTLLESAPPHCAFLILELAHNCAVEWSKLAQQLEQRLNDGG